MSKPIPFIDLGAQRRRLGASVNDAIMRVVDHGGYIMGPEVLALEADLSAFCGAKHVISCANGTDALALVLMAKDVRPGDAILCPSFTFAATAEVVAWLGATPIFVDVCEDTFNMDIESLEAGLRAQIQPELLGRIGYRFRDAFKEDKFDQTQTFRIAAEYSIDQTSVFTFGMDRSYGDSQFIG